ncbi:GTPBP1 family GTP-binding protein [Archaeoglobus veneficus]|uniref:Protein synthesis factor GTP-binding protein n=1 Tax=Archaeoglobus veneficus (strain DSM 11195 / SNP6) TaxID=693661 RepID=F2KPA0_ARCVS|nr:GTPBP1 family GTP-binding protein [Archaeoglobus veneficus]AEA47504.1 protein synthesis factor GTP-binding protein [Archaeoglobus veneficus SNP6]
MNRLIDIVKEGERENVEFKEFLTPYHLKEDRFQALACQMNHRIIMGRGKALYVVGVSDSGELRGISREQLDETLSILGKIASEIGAKIEVVEEYTINDGFVALVEIAKSRAKEHILIGTAGHVDHGKSTLVGSLITGTPDDGDGATRIYLDVLKHEIERGLSADLSFAVFGFKDGRAIKMKNPLNKSEKAWVVENADKLISFVDTVGHEPWLRTTIRGLLGQKIDYGLLVVAANDGVMRTTKEHLGILLAMDLPVIIAITKADMVEETRVKEVVSEVSKLLRSVGRVPYLVHGVREAKHAAELVAAKPVVPIIVTSAVTLEGYDVLEALLYRLPKRSVAKREFLMYIDRLYKVSGVGTVVSGSVKSGELREGEEVFIGPFHDGSFKKVKVLSMEMHYYRVSKAEAGDIVGVALKGVRLDELRRGMVLAKQEPRAVWEFEADVVVFTHPTRIKPGYEPVMHVETISEAVVFEEMDREYLKAGDRGRVRIRFKYHPHCVFEGQKFIFREGRSKGVGEIKRIFD